MIWAILKPIYRKLYERLYNSLKYRRIIPDYGNGGFHGDRVFQELISILVRDLHVTSFVETGTYMGESTTYVASRWHILPIFTCEINHKFFYKAKQRLEKFKNVGISATSSQEYIQLCIRDNRVGNLPLFFLDAHWYNYWPLEDEVKIIASSCPTAIIIIDDFEVPDRSDFGYDIGGGGSREFSGKTVIDQRICGLALIKSKLEQRNVYHALLPCYEEKDAFENRNGAFRGYIVIFQNIEDKFKFFKEKPFVLHNYMDFKISF